MDKRSLLDARLAATAAWFSGQFSVAAKNIQTGEEILVEPNKQYPTASTFKVPVMIEVFNRIEQGEIGLHDRVELTKDVIVAGSGVFRDLELGLQPTVHDVLMLMIIVSDNTATNMAINLAGGPAAITASMANLGYPSVVVNNVIDFDLIKDDNRALAVASPWDYMLIMERICKLEMISKSASEAMLKILGRQHYMGQGPRYIGYNPYADDNKLWVGNKTGSLKGMRADTGLFRMNNGVDIAWGVMNENSTAEGFSDEYEGAICNGVIGWSVLKYFWDEAELGPMPGGKSPYLKEALGPYYS